MKHPGRWKEYDYSYGEDGHARIRFDEQWALMPAPVTHQLCARLLLTLEPTTEVSIAAWEEALGRVLDPVDCWLVGILQYASAREYVLQVEDTSGFARCTAQLSDAAPAPLQIHESRGWDYFDDRICPSEVDWRQISNREDQERLLARVLATEAEYVFIHRFFGSTDGITRLREQALRDGFSLPPTPSEDPARLTLIRSQTLDLTEINRVTNALIRFCRPLGVAYDGWSLAT